MNTQIFLTGIHDAHDKFALYAYTTRAQHVHICNQDTNYIRTDIKT